MKYIARPRQPRMPSINFKELNKCYFGDCRDVLRRMIADGVKVNMVATSPPYWGLRRYLEEGHESGHMELGSEPTLSEYVANMVEVFGLVREVLTDDGVLFLNLGDSFVGKQLSGVPWRVAFALQAAGWWLRQDIIWAKPSPMPESVTDRCTKAHEYVFLMTKSARYFFDAGAIKTPVKKDWGTRNRDDGKYHKDGTGLQPHTGLTKNYTTANKRSVWTVATQSYKGAHFATFPEALVEPMILAGSRPNDIVFDPFLGSGTTAKVAQKLGRRWLGIELNAPYETLIQQRTAPGT